MKIRTLLAATAALAIIGAASARACDFNAADAQKDVDKAEVIFTGGVFEMQHLSQNRGTNDPEYKAMFNADKIYKGHAGGALNVVQMHDAWGHYVTFKTGSEYLVLAGRNDFGLVIDSCSPVMSLDPAAARSDEPGPEYRAAVSKALKDDSLFPYLAPVAAAKGGKEADKVAAKVSVKAAPREPAKEEDKDRDGD